MSDLIFLAVIAGFFAAAVGLLRACEHIIGPDPVPTSTETPPAAASDAPVEVTA